MKTEAKAWTSKIGESYSPTITQQILCANQSGACAVKSAPDCENLSDSHSPCQQPDSQQSNHGKSCAKIPLKGGQFAIIDASDLELVQGHNWRAWLNHNTYYAISSAGILMHRLLLGIHTMGREVECDHRDGDGLNNCRYNLRIATRSVNLQNRAGYGGTSKFKGVKRSVNGKRWCARIYHNEKTILLGTHDTEEQAARVYDKMALVLFGPEARLNFPTPLPFPTMTPTPNFQNV